IPVVIVPLFIVGYVATKLRGGDKRGRGFDQKYDPKTGIGRGAPGFQTGVKKLQVTPEIAARLRNGENVSQEEMEESLKRFQESKATQGMTTAINKSRNQVKKEKMVQDNEWLSHLSSSPSPSGGRKKK
ncbi:hypothetical protein IE53DRAFT_315964, partial [Violaceomyces palustris]